MMNTSTARKKNTTNEHRALLSLIPINRKFVFRLPETAAVAKTHDASNSWASSNSIVFTCDKQVNLWYNIWRKSSRSSSRTKQLKYGKIQGQQPLPPMGVHMTCTCIFHMCPVLTMTRIYSEPRFHRHCFSISIIVPRKVKLDLNSYWQIFSSFNIKARKGHNWDAIVFFGSARAIKVSGALHVGLCKWGLWLQRKRSC